MWCERRTSSRKNCCMVCTKLRRWWIWGVSAMLLQCIRLYIVNTTILLSRIAWNFGNGIVEFDQSDGVLVYEVQLNHKFSSAYLVSLPDYCIIPQKECIVRLSQWGEYCRSDNIIIDGSMVLSWKNVQSLVRKYENYFALLSLQRCSYVRCLPLDFIWHVHRLRNPSSAGYNQFMGTTTVSVRITKANFWTCRPAGTVAFRTFWLRQCATVDGDLQ